MQELPIILRIQDAKGRGPFTPGFKQEWFSARPQAEAEALAPFSQSELWEAINKLGPNHRLHIAYGCMSEEQLRRWFRPGEYKRLVALGYQAVGMQVRRILIQGETQCLFARETPLKKGAVPFTLYP